MSFSDNFKWINSLFGNITSYFALTFFKILGFGITDVEIHLTFHVFDHHTTV